MSVALGTKVFSRGKKLKRLLESVETKPIDRVIVADDGKNPETREHIYSSDWAFELTVLHLEYDAGLGAGRKALVDELDESYLFIMDTDHELPPHVMSLLDILRSDEKLGGVAGGILEPDEARMYDGCRDFEESNDGRTLRFTSPEKSVQLRDGWLFVPYDHIPQAGVFRREALEDYCWDTEYVISREHADFFLGHWKLTDWKFGLCPEIMIRHYPGGDSYYEENRKSEIKKQEADEYFLDKWDYDEIEYVKIGWVNSQNIEAELKKRIREDGVVTFGTKALKTGLRSIHRSLK